MSRGLGDVYKRQISDAIYNAIGTRFYELPITPEQIAMAAAENHK